MSFSGSYTGRGGGDDGGGDGGGADVGFPSVGACAVLFEGAGCSDATPSRWVRNNASVNFEENEPFVIFKL